MRRSNTWADDRGSAALEFVTVGLVMLVPLVYLVLTMAAIQGAALAAEGAARQAARVFVTAPDVATGQAAARRALEFALADGGIERDSSTIAVTCAPRADACLTRLGIVTVTVTVQVPLPLAPKALVGDFPLVVPLAATATQQVSRFWGAP